MKEQEEILRVMERMPEHGIKTESRRSRGPNQVSSCKGYGVDPSMIQIGFCRASCLSISTNVTSAPSCTLCT